MRKLVKLNQKKQKNNYISLCNPPELKKKETEGNIDRKHEESFSTLCVFFKCIIFCINVWRF